VSSAVSVRPIQSSKSPGMILFLRKVPAQ